MKTATRLLRKTKSGFPGRLTCLRHPEIPDSRSSRRNAFSVVAFPFERMLAMLRERCSRESQSVIVSSTSFPVFPFYPVEKMKLILDCSAADLLEQLDKHG